MNKLYVVIGTSYSPNYESGGSDKYRYVEFVTDDENIAKDFCETENEKGWAWGDTYEYEEIEVR